MNFNSTSKFLGYLTITLNALHYGIAHLACETRINHIHVNFVLEILKILPNQPSNLQTELQYYTEKSKNIMKNIKNDVSDDGNADKLCLRATQICDIKKRPGSRVTAETITDVYTSNFNGNLIFLDLSLFRLPLVSHTDFFRKYIIQNFLHATLIKCKYQTESFNTNSHIFVTTLSEYRYPLFIFKYEFTLHHVNMYRLTAEIVPTDGESSELTVKSRLPSDFTGLDS